MKERDTSDAFPADLEGVQEEIQYWARRVGEGDPGSSWEERVKERLNALYALERKYSPQKHSRLILVIRGLLKGIPWIGPAMDALIFGQE